MDDDDEDATWFGSLIIIIIIMKIRMLFLLLLMMLTIDPDHVALCVLIQVLWWCSSQHTDRDEGRSPEHGLLPAVWRPQRPSHRTRAPGVLRQTTRRTGERSPHGNISPCLTWMVSFPVPVRRNPIWFLWSYSCHDDGREQRTSYPFRHLFPPPYNTCTSNHKRKCRHRQHTALGQSAE